MKNLILKKLFGILLLTATNVYSQQYITGSVFEDSHGHTHELPGVNVYWSGTTEGTVTDTSGAFRIERPCPLHRYLVVSYVGYLNDTIDLDNSPTPLNIVLRETKNLKEVVVSARAEGTHVSRIDPIYKEIITTAELQKAACCNLSESFETNASVDVSYSDALTGAKQIQLLGLSGTYSQILGENIPLLKGPALPYGLSYVPGPWMESIQISKGTSSVINGYESITGQINVEFLKPEKADKLMLNMYANDFGRLESSVMSAVKLNEHWYTMLMLHGEYLNKRNDMNNDGFIDHPLVTKYNIFNRYKYDKPGKMESMFGFRILSEDRLAGQVDYNQDLQTFAPANVYGVNINTQRYEAFAKNGFFLPAHGSSIGTIVSGTYHKQNARFGNNTYFVDHKNFYSNIIYETLLKNSKHKLNAGTGFTYDHYNEIINSAKNIKEEAVPGIFTQYTYSSENKLTLIAGLRYDHHSLYGNFITPRLHLKYNLSEHLILRTSGGKGYRSPNVFAENTFLMMNSRSIFIDGALKAEEAWNYGASITYDFLLLGKESDISAEYYRTDFINQTVLDYEKNINEIHVYNLNGRSYSNSFQAVFNTKPFKGLDMMAAFRWNDVMTTINNNFLKKPLVNDYKGLINLSYLTSDTKWQGDFTAQFNGKSRLPSTVGYPEEFKLPERSPAYTIFNAQITFKTKKIDIYVGGENLSSFMQHHPIVSAADPFGDYFDTSTIWGPVMPRMFYAGLRFNIK